MFRNIRLVFCLLSIIFLAIGCSKKETTVKDDFEVSYNFDVPSEYYHAKEFLDSITKQGIKVSEINNSNTMALFQTKHNFAMSIKSGSENFVLIHLERKNGKEFSIVNKELNEGRFSYLINKNGKLLRSYDSNSKTYFNKNDEYITITQSKELNKMLKKVIETN